MSGNPGEINDNPDPIEAGQSVNFPSPSTNPYGTIQRASPNSFTLPPNGVFEITFQVPVKNTGELVVVLNGVEKSMTVVGKSGGGPIVGMCILATPPSITSIISINNPDTATAGGVKVDEATGALTEPLSCHLIIKQLK
jgi:hypothetical protein